MVHFRVLADGLVDKTLMETHSEGVGEAEAHQTSRGQTIT